MEYVNGLASYNEMIETVGEIAYETCQGEWKDDRERLAAAAEAETLIFEEKIAPKTSEDQEIIQRLREEFRHWTINDPRAPEAASETEFVTIMSLDLNLGLREEVMEHLERKRNHHIVRELTAELEEDLGYRPTMDQSAQYLAEQACQPLRTTAKRMEQEGYPNSSELQTIADSAETEMTQELLIGRPGPYWQQGPSQKVENWKKTVTDLTDRVNAGQGTIDDPRYRYPRPNWEPTIDGMSERSWELERAAKRSEQGAQLFNTIGIRMADEARTPDYRQQEKIITDEQMARAEDHLKALEYLLRPVDPEYWSLHDGTGEAKLEYSEKVGSQAVQDARELVHMMREDAIPGTEWAESVVSQMEQALGEKLQASLGTGYPNDLDVQKDVSERLGQETTKFVLNCASGEDGLELTDPKKIPGFPYALREGAVERTEGDTLRLAQGYLVQTRSALEHAGAGNTPAFQVAETLMANADDQAEHLAEQMQENPNHDSEPERERLAETLRTVAEMINRGRD